MQRKIIPGVPAKTFAMDDQKKFCNFLLNEVEKGEDPPQIVSSTTGNLIKVETVMEVESNHSESPFICMTGTPNMSVTLVVRRDNPNKPDLNPPLLWDPEKYQRQVLVFTDANKYRQPDIEPTQEHDPNRKPDLVMDFSTNDKQPLLN